MNCVICQTTETEQGFTCGRDRARLPRLLDEIVRRYIELGTEAPLIDSPWTVTQRRTIRDAKGKPVVVAGERLVTVSSEAGGDIAQILPMANTARSHRPRVTGSSEPAIPVNLDHIDLTGPARAASIGIRHRGDWAGRGGDPDQVGHLAIATELDWFVGEWVRDRNKGEQLPVATVPVLAGWLRERTDWACDHSLTVDEFAAMLQRVAGALRAAQGDIPARPERKDRPCPKCDLMTLVQRPGEEWIDCGNAECVAVFSEDEYAAHLKSEIKAAKSAVPA